MTAGEDAALRRGSVVLAVFGICVGLLVCEVTVRVLGAADPRPTGYAPVKTKGRAGGPTNSREYRDLERSLAKPPGVHRIVSLGDSFAWGYRIEFEDTYSQRLERVLSRLRGERWEVVNLARPGMNSVEEARQLEDEGLAYAPDLVLLGYCLNDSEDEAGAEARRGRYWEELQNEKRQAPGLLERSALFRFVAHRIEATALNRRRVAAYHEQYRADYPGWVAGQEALRTMAALCRKRGIPFVVAIFPLFGNPLGEGYPFAEIHAKVAGAARDAGAVVVDLLPAYQGLRFDLLVVDGPNDEHPNEIAHRIAAARILAKVDELVPPNEAASR